jgi:thiamin-phosphate kinase
MDIGKVPNTVLQRIVLDRLKPNRSEIIVRPKIGEDCSAVDFGEYACVLTSDPITASAKDAGKLAVHVSCNDLASSGAEPVGMLVTVLLPPEALETELEAVMDQIASTAASLNVDIIGGHTEVTAAVNKIVISGTAVGIAKRDRLVTTSGARPGDGIVLTKYAGLEGTAILAADREGELKGTIDDKLLEEARGFVDLISVVREGIEAAAFGVTAMHDVTEGGVLGALWEMCEASGTGAVVDYERIPVASSTLAICSHYHLDPLKLISSGCMLIACSEGEELVQLLDRKGIPASMIGVMTEGDTRILRRDGLDIPVLQPGADELYKVV